MKRYISNRVRSSVAEVSNRINASKDVWVVYNTSSSTVGSKKTYGIGRVISEDSRAYQIYSTTSEVYTQVSKRSVLAEFSSEPEADKYYIKLKEEKAVVSSSNPQTLGNTAESLIQLLYDALDRAPLYGYKPSKRYTKGRSFNMVVPDVGIYNFVCNYSKDRVDVYDEEEQLVQSIKDMNDIKHIVTNIKNHIRDSENAEYML